MRNRILECGNSFVPNAPDNSVHVPRWTHEGSAMAPGVGGVGDCRWSWGDGSHLIPMDAEVKCSALSYYTEARHKPCEGIIILHIQPKVGVRLKQMDPGDGWRPDPGPDWLRESMDGRRGWHEPNYQAKFTLSEDGWLPKREEVDWGSGFSWILRILLKIGRLRDVLLRFGVILGYRLLNRRQG
jgi:hypothetical protein